MKILLEKLKILADNLGIVGMKHSFEDEGAFIQDIILMRRITDRCNLSSFVKIGGCEAKNDVNMCATYGIDAVIAPMIESKFALSKFISVVSDYKQDLKSFIVIESKTAYQNLDEILYYGKHHLNGVILGRSDFSSSYELHKSAADSDFIFNKVESVFARCKQNNLLTTLGGNISIKSISFIEKMYAKNLLDRIETRNVVIGLSDKNINCLESTIKQSLDFEVELLNYKYKNLTSICNEYSNRISILTNRS